MALRIFQFSILFAIGFYLGTVSIIEGATNINTTNVSIQLQDPKDVVVVRGQSTILQCDVKSFGNNLQILWYHNDNIVPINDTRRQLQQDGRILYFPKVGNGKKPNNNNNSKRLTGEYKCLAKNDHGAVLSNPAKLQIASLDRDFNSQTINFTVYESQPAVLFCNIHSVPSARIKWEYNHTPINLPHSTRYVPLPTGALLITKTHSSHTGLYKCTATNNLIKKSKHKIIELEVLSNPMKPIPPTFLPLEISPNVHVLIGDNLSLYCVVNGWPTPIIQWLNSDSIIIGNSSILELKNVSIQHTGIYSCVAYNSGGRIFQQYSIEVQQQPYFNVTPNTMVYPSARTIRLDCQAKGVPQPEIHWLKNGKPLKIGGRIKKQWSGLVFSHTFTYDAGIYQCIAENSAGRTWVAVELILKSPKAPFPSPPGNVQCRAFNDTSICLEWHVPDNVSVQAYSIYSFYSVDGIDISGPEYLTNTTYHLASGLNSSTNYTFYVRLYSIFASDQSNTVSCKTGTIGYRNLQLQALNHTSVELEWSKVSTDVPCYGTKEYYKVQWRRKGRSLFTADETEELQYVVTGLASGTEYEFRVVSGYYQNENSTWQTLVLSGNKSENDSKFLLNNPNSTDSLLPPDNLLISSIAARKINLTWSDPNRNTKYYMICYFNIKKQDDCDLNNLIESSTNTLQVDRLEPNTPYEFKIRAHLTDIEYSFFSQTIQANTSADVPSPVLNVGYDIVSNNSVCLHWQTPLYKNGKIFEYLILYTPDRNWPLEKWLTKTVNISPKKLKNCRTEDDEHFSTLLTELISEKNYTVLIRAISDMGLGNLTVPIRVIIESAIKSNRNDPNNDETPKSDSSNQYNQKLGIILGVIVAALCIAICVACLLVRKRCLKTRTNRRGATPRSTGGTSNYYPAVAHYATEGSTVQVVCLEQDPSAAEIHEIQHLVNDDTSSHIQSLPPTHLDTKGGPEFPNGHINGVVKPYLNGNLSNGNINITENPQYFIQECNGIKNGKYFGKYEENSNSNLKTSKFQDLQRLFENNKLQSKLVKKNDNNKTNHQCNQFIKNNNSNNSSKQSLSSSSSSSSSSSPVDDDDSCFDDGISSLNTTRMTCLDNSLVNDHRLSPLLGPNG